MKKIMIGLAILITPLVFAKNITNDTITIPNDSIRIRIIANSNSLEDQLEKNNIRKSIQTYLEKILKDSTNIQETDNIIRSNIKNIKKEIEKTLTQNKSNNSYTIHYGKNFFPKKEYKGVTYESGLYDSLVITIGEGKGNNWWCVLYPPLCLIDEDVDEKEYKLYIKEVLENFK